VAIPLSLSDKIYDIAVTCIQINSFPLPPSNAYLNPQSTIMLPLWGSGYAASPLIYHNVAPMGLWIHGFLLNLLP
jgi:hypothetical protein